MAAVEATPASAARAFAVSWSTVWAAVASVGQTLVDDPARVGPVRMVGFDETVMSPSSRRRRRRFVTAVVDVATSQILDVFEGRDAKDLRAWMATMASAWLAGIEVVSVDPHEGDRAVRDAVAALFRDSRIDPLIVIRWKDVYDTLEEALDACETAANVIANIVVKNA